VYFGREREVNEVRSLIIAEPIVLLYAASGAGKTSMINAGVVPGLEEQYEVLSMGRLRSASEDVTPPPSVGNVFVLNALDKYIRGATARNAPDQTPRQRIRKDTSFPAEDDQRFASGSAYGPTPTPLSVPLFLSSRKLSLSEGTPRPRLLIFDQLEELFYASHEPRITYRKEFFGQVRQALAEDKSLRVLFAMREDYVAHLDRFAGVLPGGLQTRYRLEPLRWNAALIAVIEPLKRTTTASFAPGVAEKLVDDLMQVRIDTGLGTNEAVRGEFVDPVQLQVVCQTLWAQLPAGVDQITEQHLVSYGNVDQALSRFYDEAIAAAALKASTGERELRGWFERIFITPGETRNFVYRTPTTTSGVANEAIDELVSRHLIKPEVRAGARWYELNHDRFIKPIVDSNKAFLFELAGVPTEDYSEKANQALAHAEEARWTSRLDDAIAFTERALELYRQQGDRPGMANALSKQAEIRRATRQFSEARNLLEQARTIYVEAQDKGREANTLRACSEIAHDQGDEDEALRLQHLALAIHRQLGDQQQVASTLTSIAVLMDARGQHVEALGALGEALTIYRIGHDRRQEANTLGNLAAVYYQIGSFTKALELYQQTLAIDRELKDRWGEANTLRDIGFVKLQMDDWAGALELLNEALEIYREIDDRPDEGSMLTTIGGLYAARGDLAKAAEFKHAAFEVYRDLRLDREAVSTLGEIAAVSLQMGDYPTALNSWQTTLQVPDPMRAQEFEEAALRIYEEIGDKAGRQAAASQLAELIREGTTGAGLTDNSTTLGGA
jgi:tetratricopeptide (TPR) repeat protein